jgi:hypothetical protein
VLVDERPSGDVDHVRTWPQRIERVGVEQVPRRVGRGGGHHDVVGPSEGLGERPRHLDTVYRGGCRRATHRDDVHPEVDPPAELCVVQPQATPRSAQ